MTNPAPSFTDPRLDNRTRRALAAELAAEGSQLNDAVRDVVADEQQSAGVVTSIAITTIAAVTAAEYAALDPAPDDDTLYIIKDGPALYLGATAIVAL